MLKDFEMVMAKVNVLNASIFYSQEFYVPLTTKGEFYEIHSSVKAKLCFPGMLDKTGPLALDKDCLYKIPHLLRRVALPIKVKLMVGPLPHGVPKDFPGV